MRCVLVGNYGVSNVGDEALRQYFLSRFGEISWTVLSANPAAGEVPRLPAGIRSFFGTPWLRTIRAIRKSDAMVFGGGSLFTDAESPFACFLWWLHAAVARFCGVPLLLAFQGIGPFRTKRGEWFARWVVRRSAFIAVRDAESEARVRSWSMNSSCIRTADPVFILAQNLDSNRAQKMIAVIPRLNADEAFRTAFGALLQRYPDHQVLIVSMQPDDPSEQSVTEELRAMAGARAGILPARTMDELLQTLSGASLVLTQRYHGAIAAMAAGAPVEIVPQKEGDKMWALRELLKGKDAYHEAKRLRSEALQGEEALKTWFAQAKSA